MRTFAPVIAIIFCALLSRAQESYTIRMQIKMEGLPAEYAALAEQDIISYVKGNKSKTEISSVMYNSEIYYVRDSLTMISDVMGNRNGFVASKAELESTAAKSATSKPDIKYTGEKKNIAGYECTKAVITQTDEKHAGTRTVVWVTEKIKADATPRRANQSIQDLGDLKGFPLEMEIETQAQGKNVKVIMTTQEVLTAELPDSKFEPVTDGVKILPYREWQEQMKAGKGSGQ